MQRRHRPIVKEDPTLTLECSRCSEVKPRTNAFFYYANNREKTLMNHCKVCQNDAAKERTALGHKANGYYALVEARPVVFGELGTQASVGWFGDVEYFPIQPLLPLTRFTTMRGLLVAIKNDTLIKSKVKNFSVLCSDGKMRATLHLPWSHFNTFITKYGNEQTKPQQERVQKVIEAAFGRTAASNLAAVARLDQDVTVAPVAAAPSPVDLRSVLRDSIREIVDEMRPWWSGITQIHTETRIDVRGVVYVCKYPRFAWRDAEQFYGMGWDRYAIGWTAEQVVANRLRHYSGKYDLENPEEIRVIETDNKKLEGIIHERRPLQGVSKVPRLIDVFWLSPDALGLLLGLPAYLPYELACQRLIRWVMVKQGAEIMF